MASKSMFNVWFKVVAVAAALIFILIVGFWGVVGYGAYKVGSAVEERGLKSVVGKLWNGSDKQATPTKS